MTQLKRIIFICLLLLIIPSCSQTAATPHKTSFQELLTQATKTLTPPNGALIGRLVSKTQGGKPLAGTPMRLAQIYYNEDKSASNWVLEGGSSPGAITDADGYFSFNNLGAYDYVMIIGDINDQYYVMVLEDGEHAIVYTVLPGKVLDVQTVEAGFPFVK